MSRSPNRKSIVLGLVDLERQDGQDAGWDAATVLVAASRQRGLAEGRAPDVDDLAGVVRSGLVHRRSSDGRYELSESARVRAREGSL